MDSLYQELLTFIGWLNGTPTAIRWFAIAGLICLALVTIAVIWLILLAVGRAVKRIHRPPRRPCHQCHMWTRRRSRFDGLFCNAGKPCCEECADDHAFRSVPDYACPACGARMVKDWYLEQIMCFCPDNACSGPVVLQRGGPDELYSLGREDERNRRNDRLFSEQVLPSDS